MRVIEGVVVHCSATRPDFMAGANTVARFAEIRRWHVENEGWSDIGYHFGIDRPGGVTSLRPLERTGAHVKFHNARTIGVVLLGGHGAAETDRFQDHFTAAQERSLIDLLLGLEGRFGDIWIKGHNEFAAKACPGFNVPRWWAGVLDGAPAFGDAPRPDPAPAPTDTVPPHIVARWRLAAIRDAAEAALDELPR